MNKFKHIKWGVLAGLVLLLIVSGAALAAGDFSIDWWTVDGGGATSSGGDYSLSGTIGQPDAGQLSGGNFRVNGGFWQSVSAIIPPNPPGVFNKNMPSNGASNQPTSPTLSWESSSDATEYEYCYGTSNDNTCSSWTSNGSNTSKSLSSLTAGTTYYWHVRASNSDGITYANGSNTAFWSFTTTPNVPGAFNKSTPSNGATDQPANPTLSWQSSNDATEYEYCYDTSNDNTCSSWTSNGVNTSKSLSSLIAGTTYYWHVRASNSGGTTYANGSAAAFWEFTTEANLPNPPGEFNKSTPSNGTIDQPTSPTLSWEVSSGATGYAYCYDTQDNGVCDSDWHDIGNSTDVVFTNLRNGTKYYWQIRANNTGGMTEANNGNWWNFTTKFAVYLPVILAEN